MIAPGVTISIAPGATIGIIGGGQLGRMLAMAAARLGYRCHVFHPEASGPATEVAAEWTHAPYDDRAALARFAGAVKVITYEFENVPVEPLEALGAGAPPVRHSPGSLRVAQDRLAEKAFVAGQGGTPARHWAVGSAGELRAALGEAGGPCVLKTRWGGYDGHGQVRLSPGDNPAAAWAAIGGRPAVLEAFVAFEAEFSVILARGADGAVATWAAPHNVHRGGILHRSEVPAGGLIEAQAAEATALAGRVAAALDHVGVLTLEFFACAGGPVFNEMAPRVHNSGHWTIEGAVTSQFENHVRAICGLPLGSTALRGAGARMENLLGDEAGRWPELLADGQAHLHLYGKREGRPGRKMGHVTWVG